MHRLSVLNLSSNSLEVVIGLEKTSFTNLEVLNLADNQLRTIDFRGCRIPNIEQFILSNNPALVEILGLEELRLSKLRNILVCKCSRLLRPQQPVPVAQHPRALPAVREPQRQRMTSCE